MNLIDTDNLTVSNSTTTATAICSNNTITTTGWNYDYSSTGI